MSDFVNTVDIVGDEALIASIIDGSITEIFDNISTSIGRYAFDYRTNLTTASFSEVTSIGIDAFSNCTGLTVVDFRKAVSIGEAAFDGCRNLVTADFRAATRIGPSAFKNCKALTALILRSETMCTLGSYAFSYNSIESGTGYIYVPRALVDSYKAESNWSTYANQFRALEDYTVDGTTTGALDESKI